MMSLPRRSFGVFVAGFLLLAVAVASVRADRVTLADGTVVFGTAIQQGNQYWVKGEDGKTQKVDKGQVKSIEKGVTAASAKAPAAAPKTGAATPPAKAPAAPSTGTPAPTTPAAAPPGATTGVKKSAITLAAAQSRCNSVTKPMQAVIIWQEFLDSKPTGEELKTAQAEMAKWKALADGEAEKINGKWVGGADRKAILDKAEALNKQGIEMMNNNQTLQALKKFQEVVAVYPNSFRANFLLGYINCLQEKGPDAQKYFEAALKLQPDNPETMSNLGLLLINKKRYADAIKMMHKAAESRDSKPIAMNLCFAVWMAPPASHNSQQLKPAIEAARLLSAKYGIPENNNHYIFVPLMDEDLRKPDALEKLAGTAWSGTGFIIEDTGLILTNRHVADKAKSLMVMLSDKTQRSAEVVVIDDKQDLALIKLKNDEQKQFPIVQLAGTDVPGDGAECTVMGFPLLDRMGASVKVTRGIVSSSTGVMSGPDVVIDAKVNPGNSGGPILDKYGNVMAIVSMKSITTNWEDSYGLGISAGNIRKFLSKNKVAMTAGDTAAALSAEEIAAKVKPATVCILATQ